MKLIVGLGNPGKEYEQTRHNVGFSFLDFYLDGFQFKEKYNSLIGENIINGEKVIFLKPLTYMNESGRAVRKIKDYYDIKKLNDLDLYGVIIGKALYSGNIDLKKAINLCNK